MNKAEEGTMGKFELYRRAAAAAVIACVALATSTPSAQARDFFTSLSAVS
jgi:hypothetical protein